QLFIIPLSLLGLLHVGMSEKLPNIVLILTDDQDVELYGMHPMEKTITKIGREGAAFYHAYTPTPICCPARASLLTGMYAHNHGTQNNSVSGGCYGSRWRAFMEPRSLPIHLQRRGYTTFFAGKYLNQYPGSLTPVGWHHFYGLHGNSRYYNYTLRENTYNVHYDKVYLTDLLRDRAVDFLKLATQSKNKSDETDEDVRPFFAMITPPAAHAPFTPAPRHNGVFDKINALRTPSFNKPVDDKHWLVRSSRPLHNITIDTIDSYYRKRWETLLAVDELVEEVVNTLNQTGVLDNTYVIFSSDNGYHVGQFAQPFDKRQPYETDIHIPLLIRGPGITPESRIDSAVSLVDLAPTILSWANVSIPSYMDGHSFHEMLMESPKKAPLVERSMLIEYWGEGNLQTYNAQCPESVKDRLAECTPDAECHCQDSWNNTYACVREVRYRLNRIYCEFHDNEHFQEAYDLDQDSYQMTNSVYDLLPSDRALLGLRLKNLTHCSGRECFV
ncbi:hypothetical protein KR074_011007, partial [Drosophila pseudoananassae]